MLFLFYFIGTSIINHQSSIVRGGRNEKDYSIIFLFFVTFLCAKPDCLGRKHQNRST